MSSSKDIDDLKEEIARERYGRSYEELDTREKQSVAGVIGALKRKGELGSEGYSEEGTESTDDLKEEIARERFGRSYDELDTNEKRAVAGVIGALKRKGELGSEVNTQ